MIADVEVNKESTLPSPSMRTMKVVVILHFTLPEQSIFFLFLFLFLLHVFWSEMHISVCVILE